MGRVVNYEKTTYADGRTIERIQYCEGDNIKARPFGDVIIESDKSYETKVLEYLLRHSLPLYPKEEIEEEIVVGQGGVIDSLFAVFVILTSTTMIIGLLTIMK